MKFRYLLFIFFCVALWTGCYNEDDIVPTEGNEMMYSLPQGTHEYDDDIVQWFKDYGFYTVYEYDVKDLYWANTGWEEQVEPNLGGYLTAKKADPDYVAPVLGMFQEFFLDYYSGDLLKEAMPLKVFLCSELWQGSWYNNRLEGIMERGDSIELMVYRGYDYIALNGARKDFEITEGVKTEFMRGLHKIFLNILYNKAIMTVQDDFAAVSKYVAYSNMYPSDPNDFDAASKMNCFAQGYLNIQTAKSIYSVDQMKEYDFMFYLNLVMSYSLAELEQEEAYWKSWDNQPYMDYRGLLNPRRGFYKVRQKYEIMVEYIESFGVNLDRIRFPERFEPEGEEGND